MIIEIGAFEVIGNNRNWAFQKTVNGWSLGFLRHDPKQDKELYQAVAYPVTLINCVNMLWDRLIGELGDIKLSTTSEITS